MKKVPVIDITDLYHPHQDVGDNVDIVSAFALPEIDLKAIIIDVTAPFRMPFHVDAEFGPQYGPREPGIIPITQLNYLFGRNVPYGIGTEKKLNSVTDDQPSESSFFNGATVLLDALDKADEPVHILCFGSLRPLAVALNRNERLVKQKTACIHVCAGSSGNYTEWNVRLDPLAYIRVLRSEIPIDLYPCATEHGPFDVGENNTFWQLSSFAFAKNMHPSLRRYLQYAFGKCQLPDYLSAMSYDFEEPELLYGRTNHNVWETAVWMSVADRSLVSTPEGFRYKPSEKSTPSVLTEEMKNIECSVDRLGHISYHHSARYTGVRIYKRELPINLFAMLSEALGGLYCEYQPK